MAVRRPSGRVLPLGNAKAGHRQRAITFPGAGERVPQSEVVSGTPPGELPTMFGTTGLKPFLPGRTSVKRSYQKLTDRRVSPFFIDVPTGLEVGQNRSPFLPEQASDRARDVVTDRVPDRRGKKRRRMFEKLRLGSKGAAREFAKRVAAGVRGEELVEGL